MSLAHSIPAPVTDWAEETERYLAASAKLDTSDIDWAEARRAGLSADEVWMLTYFSDIENQTIVYMRDLMDTDAALEEDVVAFLSMWNYEEFFHGHALARLVKECGHSVESNRIAKARERTSITETLEKTAASFLSKLFRKDFPAVHAAWGAVQEFTTLNAYESLGTQTKNPVLRTLCERIAKQERRHFAWYFNKAKDRLRASRTAQRLTRTLLQNFWSPVGAGVKSKAEVARMMQLLFPGDGLWHMAHNVDSKIGALPGLEGIALMVPYAERTLGKARPALERAPS